MMQKILWAFIETNRDKTWHKKKTKMMLLNFVLNCYDQILQETYVFIFTILSTWSSIYTSTIRSMRSICIFNIFLHMYISVWMGSVLPLQPLGPNWNVAGAQMSQFLPTTWGRHWHWPPLGTHTVLREPWRSHWHSGKTIPTQGMFKSNINNGRINLDTDKLMSWDILRTSEECEEEETSRVS